MHRLQILAAAALMSTGGAAIKSCTLSAIEVAGLRSLVAACVLLLLRRARSGPFDTRALLVGMSLAATMVSFVAANKLTTAANAIFLQSSAPLYVLLLAPRLLGERIRMLDLAHMLALAVGLCLFFLGEQAPSQTAPQPWLGNLIATASGVTWAGTILGLRWLASGPDAAVHGGSAIERARPSALPALVAGNLLAFAIALPWIADGGPAARGDWLVIAYLGAFQVGLAYFCFDRGVRHVPAIEASLLVLIEPSLSPLWAWLVHGERTGSWALAGGALILGSTAVKTIIDGRVRRDG